MTLDEDSTDSTCRRTDSHWHRVAAVENLSEGERLVVDVEGIEIAVFCVDGDYYAVSNFCVHQGGPVCEGPVGGTLTESTADGDLDYGREGRVVSCPWHGWEFDVTTGGHLAPTDYELPTYDTVVDDGCLYLSLPSRE